MATKQGQTVSAKRRAADTINAIIGHVELLVKHHEAARGDPACNAPGPSGYRFITKRPPQARFQALRQELRQQAAAAGIPFTDLSNVLDALTEALHPLFLFATPGTQERTHKALDVIVSRLIPLRTYYCDGNEENGASEQEEPDEGIIVCAGGFEFANALHPLTGRPLKMLDTLLKSRHHRCTRDELRQALGVDDEAVNHPDQVVRDTAKRLRAALRKAGVLSGDPLPSTGKGADLTYSLAVR